MSGGAVGRQRVWRELRRQPRWFYLTMLASAGCTFTSLLLTGPTRSLGGPVWYFAALCGSGALLVLSIILIVSRGGSDGGDR